MIERTAALLRDQTGDATAETTRNAVDLAALQRAWDAVYATLDQIDSYKSTALATMQATAREMADQLERSRARLEQGELGADSAEGSTLRLQ